MIRTITLIAALVAVAATATGQTFASVDYAAHNLTITSAHMVSSPVRALAVDGSLVYTLDRDGGLNVLDYTEPDAPVLRGGRALAVTPRAAVLAAGRLWIAAGDTGLLICTVAGADLGPAVVVPLPVTAVGVAVTGAAVAVAGGAGGLALLDATVPDAPVVTAVFDLFADVDGVAALADRFYAATRLGVGVVVAADPAAPEPFYYLGVPPCTAVATAPGRLYGLGDKLFVIDVTDPDVPCFCGQVNIPSSQPTGLAAWDDRVYVSAAALNVLAVDAADTHHLRLGAVASLAGNGTAVAVVAGRPLLADDAARLVTLRDDASGPLPVIGWTYEGAGVAVDCLGASAGVARNDDPGRIGIVDLTDPTAPTTRLACNMYSPPKTVLFCGGTVWATPDYLPGLVQAWDLSDPDRAVPIALSDRTRWWERTARWRGALVARERTHLYVYDLSVPSAPVCTGTSMPIPPGTGAFAVVGDLAVTALDGGGLAVFKLQEAGDPEFMAYQDDGRHIVAMAGAGDRLFAVSDGDGPGIREISLADATAPVDVAFHALPGVACRAVRLIDGVLYAAITGGGIQTYDVATPGWINPNGAWAGRGSVADLAPYAGPAGTLLVVVSAAGLEIVPLNGGRPAAVVPPPAQASAALRASPNPFNPSVTFNCLVPRPGPVSAMVYDLAGRRVAVLAQDVVVPAGETSWTWRGTDAAGRAVPSGVYCAEVTGPGLRAVRKVALVR